MFKSTCCYMHAKRAMRLLILHHHPTPLATPLATPLWLLAWHHSTSRDKRASLSLPHTATPRNQPTTDVTGYLHCHTCCQRQWWRNNNINDVTFKTTQPAVWSTHDHNLINIQPRIADIKQATVQTSVTKRSYNVEKWSISLQNIYRYKPRYVTIYL